MKDAVAAYLALRRAAGFEMASAEYLLESFGIFATRQNETHVRTETAIEWAAHGPSAAQRDARLKAICRFARHIRAEDDRHELPPANYFGCRKTRRMPYIYSSSEISHLLEAAGRLGPRGTTRAQTYATLIALLASTGLRVSEALKLRIADITDDGLIIRETKFRKTRLVPLHDTAAAELQRYLMRRHEVGVGDDHVFVGRRGRALPYSAVQCTFKTVLKAAGICTPPGRHRPRLHDLRHSFAVRALQASPTGRGRIGQHMVALATYLGHVNIYATYWYLEATADRGGSVSADTVSVPISGSSRHFSCCHECPLAGGTEAVP